MEWPEKKKQYFTKELIRWHGNVNQRSLPWKAEKDPYKIWLSEVILQQTRAEQGLPYYLKFTEKYPTVHELAEAVDEEVFRLWQGLGYYNRCKNLLTTARYISRDLKGEFPRDYEGLLKLKGIGPYTAAAIASFAYNLPQAVVDGNVYRVLGRYFGIEVAYDSKEGKMLFQSLADKLLDRNNSSGYNQAIMDLGATVCTPQLPKCVDCPLQKNCVAYDQDMVKLLPVKSKKATVKKRYFHYVLLTTEDKMWIHKRVGNDIWQNLYQPLLIEEKKGLGMESVKSYVQEEAGKSKWQYEGKLTQRLTHQLIETRFYKMQCTKPFPVAEKGGEWVEFGALKNYPFPKTLVSFLEKKFYF